MNSGDTAWVLTAGALVLLMTIPGLAFFYGGLVRRKNVLSILMQCFIIVCVISLQWVLFGYSLAFGPDFHGIIGTLEWAGLAGVGAAPNSNYAATIPHSVFMIFQAMFAIITPALIIGAYAERVKFPAFLLFTLLWATFVYDPLAHWVWGAGGWLKSLGGLDFAGGIVVHVSSGISALVLALLLGKRVGYNHKPIRPHNLPFTVLGAALLWFGWFGFNAGSALAADGLAANAFVTTNTATAAAGLTWALIEWWHNGTPTILGVATGAVAGLVAVTPACGFVNPMNAIFIGIIVALVCYTAVAVIKGKLGYDDSLDAFGVHGVGGTVGTIATGLFAEKAVNAAGADGLLFGNLHQFGVQCLMLVVTIAFAAIMTFIIFKIVDAAIGMRVEENNEIIGLDLTQQSEAAYTVIE
ncbi:MAG: ammonium transporter [Smithellaceae bacterium]|jgi:Amt family ammonium transporter|nr:ammonium transporter [Smithellaceae bacterium]MDD3259423.1 ammonium transporter [Smithellaceae bacterium]MDD3848722.1 ammonium transporter [Smithellaceae bacterium]HOQ71793.1 ammonium transporter [Smithellaceae bacterium]HPL09528.1 ammonium transporter [Smithellaceae bacterium]